MQHPPTPPTPPLTPSLSTPGQSLSQTIKEAVGGALGEVSTELTKELARETARRDRLQAQLNNVTSSSDRATLRGQIADANVNVAKLEAAVAKLNAKAGDLTISPAAGTFTTETQPPFFPPPQDVVPEKMIISVVSIIFIGFPLAIAFARLLWKRGTAVSSPAAQQQLPADTTRRFDELSHSVDAIAIEVERISENQRYLTKLLSEPRSNAAVSAGRGGAPPSS
jgi:uncharacterized coiled-coil protein SlyX